MLQIRELQREDQVDRRLKNSQDVTKKKSKMKKPVKLTCRKCGADACKSNDIRSVKDAHHIVINDEFHGLYDTKENPRFPLQVDDFDFQKSIICKKCKSEWGVIGMYKGLELPILKIAGFIVEYPNGKQQRTKKWKDVLFQVQPITPEDLEKVINTGGGEEEDDDDDEENIYGVD